MKKAIISSIMLSIIVWLGCTRETFVQEDIDCDDVLTYIDDMIPIIDTYCAYSGCHDGNTSNAVDYTSYSSMERDFDQMFDRVVTQQANAFRGMPRDDGDGPDEFEPEDFILFNCWIDQNFPEN